MQSIVLLDSVSFGHIFLKKVEGFKSKNERLVLSAPEKSENALEEEQIGEGTTSSSLEAEKSRFLETLGKFVLKFKFNYLKTEMLCKHESANCL